MPQLNPAPWLTTLITAWAIFLLLMKLTMNYTTTTPPDQSPKQTNTQHWPWTWQ